MTRLRSTLAALLAIGTLTTIAGCPCTNPDCNGEGDVGTFDAPFVPTDTPRASDAPAMDTGAADAPVEPTDAPSPTDALAVDALALDASAVDGPTPVDAAAIDLGAVQCRSDADCPGISTCNRTAPGGVCLGCGSDGDCPSGTRCGPVGACVRDCSTDGDCNAGMRCGDTDRCGIRDCASCPAPYVCSGDRCARPTCGGAAACPSPLVCAAGVCVEP